MKLKVSLGQLSEVIDALDQYKADLNRRCRTFLERLAAIGVDTADVRFRTAQYDGTNDVTVFTQWDGDNKVKVIGKGNSVTFIEFGSGVYYQEEHPLASEKGAERGGYGQGRGKGRTWGYYGEDPGSNGKVIQNKKGETVILTHGNPPSRAMYEASKAMREQVLNIAREVFGT